MQLITSAGSFSLNKFMKCQVAKIVKDEDDSDDYSDDFVFNWINKNSSEFRQKWNKSLCKSCKYSDECGWSVVQNCIKYKEEEFL